MLDLISIFQVAQKKGNSILLGLCKEIVNHFWFSCREHLRRICGEWPTYILFKRRISLYRKLPFHFEWSVHVCVMNKLQDTEMHYTLMYIKPFNYQCIWRSVLHHITNTHEWFIPHGGVNHCLHGNIDEEERKKVWLSPTKDAHVLKDLATVVLDKRLLNNVWYLLNFR